MDLDATLDAFNAFSLPDELAAPPKRSKPNDAVLPSTQTGNDSQFDNGPPSMSANVKGAETLSDELASAEAALEASLALVNEADRLLLPQWLTLSQLFQEACEDHGPSSALDVLKARMMGVHV
jgi:hypothetical protein